MVNFIENYAIIGGIKHDLDDIRAFLLEKHPTLCANHFIKVIIKKGNQFFTYDWEGIFTLAKQIGILQEYKPLTHEIN